MTDPQIFDEHHFEYDREAMAEAAEKTQTITATMIEWLAIAANLHLAVKHPANNGESAMLARRWIREIIYDCLLAGMDIPEEVLQAYEEDVGRIPRPRGPGDGLAGRP